VVRLTENAGVIYEVNLEADAEIAGPFDTWLRDHIADMLQLPGFQAAEILEDTAAPQGKVRRTVQYRLRDQAALDDYLRFHAPRMRQQGVERFGDRYVADRRVLAHREDFITGAVSTENCLNCGEVLTGQHCSHCGQRARVQVISLWGLIKDFFGDVFDWDSRLWRTLRPLAFRPGLLTQEYLRGRRAHYTPPFRMYLILSVVFFLMASIFDRGNDIDIQRGGGTLTIRGNDIDFQRGGGALTINRDAATKGGDVEDAASASKAPATPDASATPAKPARSGNTTRGKVIEDLVRRMPVAERAEVRAELNRELAEVSDAQLEKVQQVIADPCSGENFRLDAAFLEQYEPRLRQACTKIVGDWPSFKRALWENLPKMMFLFLPLIALVMAFLYLGSGRYYVEHLLFFLHYHAFFFLAGIAILLLDWIGERTSGGAAGFVGALEGILGTVFTIYVPVYLYLAMRRVYRQGRIWTFTKFSALAVAYLVCLTLTGVGLLFYTALTL
jgi:hypothetical protein